MENTQNKIKVYITPTLITFLDYMNSNYSHEIMGWLVGNVKDGSIYIKDILIPEQNVSGAGVNISAQSQMNLLKKYGKKCQNILGHWHSHVNMGVFWSAIDDNEINEYMRDRDLRVFIVTSRGEHLIRIEMRKPLNLRIDNAIIETKSTKLDMLKSRLNKIVKNLTIYDYVQKTEDNSCSKEFADDIVEEHNKWKFDHIGQCKGCGISDYEKQELDKDDYCEQCYLGVEDEDDGIN